MLLRQLDFEDPEGVRFILDHGGDVNHPGQWNKTPLHQAIMRERSLECIRLLVERGANCNATRNDGATPWYLAWLYGRGDVAKCLQESGCETLLNDHCQFIVDCARNNATAVKAMLKTRPDIIESLSRDEQQVIVVAARVGNRDGLATMLDAGLDIATTDNQGFTPRHWAAWYGHVECVMLLIERGAPFELENNYGGTVVDGAVWGWTHSDGDGTNGTRILQILFEAGADLSKISPRPVRNERIESFLVDLIS